jgi:dipeptidyl aminopeptidase/acylaminoacyl peptidase
VRGSDLHVVSLDGTARRMTTTADVTDVCWSPDGLTLAYGRRDRKDQDLGLWRQAACGSKPVRLVPSTGDVFAASGPAWSPDGKQIAFLQAWEGGGLGFVSADGKTKRVGADSGWFPLLWLGDSSAVVYDGTNPEGPVRGLCVCTPAGQPRVLVKGLVVGYDMLPDGRVVAVRAPEEASDQASGARELTVLLADAARPEAKPRELGTVKGVAPAGALWRPDGGVFVVVGETPSSGPDEEVRRLVYLGTPDSAPGLLTPAVSAFIGWVKAPAR